MKKLLHLFEGFGIELEYMIVDRYTLAVKPICDEVIRKLHGTICNEISLGQVNISNELVLHVIELKGNGPQKDLRSLRDAMQNTVRDLNHLLIEWDACLLPTAMHPLMNPLADTRIWPHGQNAIYQTYDRIFNCKGHGWSNLQSVHINLPFANDEEFGRLHAAIRIVLPFLPALAASSPLVEGKMTGTLDNRLAYYAQNQKRIPSIIGSIVPEAIFTQSDYEKQILKKIEADIQEFDPDGVLEGEWLNSRGAIARFERNAIEIRVLDVQECLPSDFALVSLIISFIRALVDEKFLPFADQRKADEKPLKSVFMGSLEQGGAFYLEDPFLLKAFGLSSRVRLHNFWQWIAQKLMQEDESLKPFEDDIRALLSRGSLSSRLSRELGPSPNTDKIVKTWKRLALCLDEGRFYG